MSSIDEQWLLEYPHRILIQQVLMDIAKVAQCQQCGSIECKTNRRTTHSISIGKWHVPPRCSFDLSGVLVK